MIFNWSALNSHGWGPYIGAAGGGTISLASSLYGMVTPDALTSYFTAIGFGLFGLANVAIIVYHRWQEARRDEYQRTQAIEREQYHLWVEAEILAIKARAGLSTIGSASANHNPGTQGPAYMDTPDVVGGVRPRSLESPRGASEESAGDGGRESSIDGNQAADDRSKPGNPITD